MNPTVMVISTSHGAESLSRQVARMFAGDLREKDIKVDFADMRELPPIWVTADALKTAGDTWRALGERVAQADAVVFAAPVFFYSVGSPARVSAELLGDFLAGKPIGLITAAGSSRSTLAHREFLCSLFDEVGAQILPKPFQVTSGDFDQSGALSGEPRQRVRDLAESVAYAAQVHARRRHSQDAAA